MDNPLTAIPVVALALVGHTLLHELAHALAARAVGFQVTGVRWNLFFPGVIVWDGLQELIPGPRLRWMAVHLAGVIANLALAGASALVAGVSPTSAVTDTFFYRPDLTLSVALAGTGLVMAAVNLIPAPPVDGGRAIVALITGHAGPRLRAVHIALWGVTACLVAVLTLALLLLWR